MNVKMLGWNVLTWVLFLGTIALGIIFAIWFLIFIAEHAFNYGQVCQLC